MAEECTKAFGRYLKTLRERRQLSLENVRSLSQTFPDQINKGYLSRCENGHQRLSFSKVIPLSRIYEVPADVLVERMELDMELDRVGGPETEGKTFAELTSSGRLALQKGFSWNAYGYLRDSIRRAPVDQVSSLFKDIDEQIATAFMNCATAARVLGRHRFALNEYLHLEKGKGLGPKLAPLLLERISGCYAALRNKKLAESYADAAVTRAEECDDHEFLGYVYDGRGLLALQENDLLVALTYYQKAYDTYKESDRIVECARALNCLAQCYFDLKKYRAARLSADASLKISVAHNQNRAHALSLILLGEIDEIENKPTKALSRWKTAVDIAKRTKDKELRFKAEFVLLQRAERDGNQAVVRAIRRRLVRLSPWISANTPELEKFRRLTS